MKQPQPKFRKAFWGRMFSSIIVILAGVILVQCQRKTPIKIGFAGCLTGRYSDLGIAGRNGVMLAVEQINQAGGINGRPIELLIKDDQHDSEIVRQVDQALIQEGVAAIIGHMTSTVTMAIVPLFNQEKTLLISPIASTAQLSHLDDYFFRIMPPSKTTSDYIANYIFHPLNLRAIACVYDLSNPTYSQGWYQDFTATFTVMGGHITSGIGFTSEDNPSYLDLAKQVLETDPEGVMIIAGALDTAMLAQQIRKLGTDLPLFASGWAYTSDLIQHGGLAVEGLILSHTFSKDSQHESFRRFTQQFSERFHAEPSFAATYGYEAAMLLFEALRQNQDVSRLKATILSILTFPGLQGDIQLDQYGDNQRQPFLITVKDGQFMIME